MKNLWEYIQRIYEEKFNLPGFVIDFVACEDIIVKCLSGYSNKRISRYYKNDLNYIQEVLTDLLKFDGWGRDLDINPLAIYNTCDNYSSFYYKIKSVTYVLSDDYIKLSWELCEKFYEMKGKAYEYIDKSP